MIIDLDKFLRDERPHWSELEAFLNRMSGDPDRTLGLTDVRRFHYLYQRTSADLAKIMTFASAPDVTRYLESLVERAYGEIHETRERPHRVSPLDWFFRVFPTTVRRHRRALWPAVAIFLAGMLFGGLAVSLDPEAKSALMPWPHLRAGPTERVQEEEGAEEDRLEGLKGGFSSKLMTHNTKVSIMTMAMGMTWGLGTVILLFTNGVILGAVALDYILAGETLFLLGWLLPHGAVEIPSILLAGQAGLVLAGALIGWGESTTIRSRLRQVSRDLVTLILGVALMLVWAGIVEAFLSQYHEPVLPYELKIGFGVVELGLLFWFFTRSGSGRARRSGDHG